MIKRIVAVFGLLLVVQGAAYANEMVEIPIEKALIPAQGFDDNDNVQLLIHGHLPDTCHLLSHHRVEWISRNQFRIRQFAVKLEQGYCTEPSHIPPHFSIPLPYKVEINLGQLRAAKYRIHYAGPGAEMRARDFQVDVARTPAVDDLSYAWVSGASGPSAIPFSEPVKVELHGILNSSCVRLAGVHFQRQGDVFVVLPTIYIKPNTPCLEVISPWSYSLNLGQLAPGDYLVHVRSTNGASVNHFATVVKNK